MLETQARMSEADDFVRCDKNGDGKLSEEEVMQVRNETRSHVVFCSFFFFMFTKSDFLKLVMHGKGYSFECLRKQVGES